MGEPFQNDTFVSEAEELLGQIESAILALEANPENTENIHLLFRVLHTLKGSSAVVGLDAIASFSHHLETALDRVRNGSVRVTSALISVILASRDHVLWPCCGRYR